MERRLKLERPPQDIGAASSVARVGTPRRMIERVVDEVAAETGVPAVEILGKRKARRIKAARWESWRRLARPNASIIDIARKWPCDHTSILNALGRLNRNQGRDDCTSSHSQA